MLTPGRIDQKTPGFCAILSADKYHLILGMDMVIGQLCNFFFRKYIGKRNVKCILSSFLFQLIDRICVIIHRQHLHNENAGGYPSFLLIPHCSLICKAGSASNSMINPCLNRTKNWISCIKTHPVCCRKNGYNHYCDAGSTSY